MEGAVVRSFRDLEVWRLGIDLVEAVYRVGEQFPRTEAFGLTSQLQRAAVSVPSNVAEGHARSSRKEFLQFISIALGSLAEVETQLVIAERLGYLPAEEHETIFDLTLRVGRMLRGLQKSLKSRD